MRFRSVFKPIFAVLSAALVAVVLVSVTLGLIGVLEPAFAQSAVATVTAPADAPTSTQVVVPAGDWVTWSLNNLKEVLTLAVFSVLTWLGTRIVLLLPSLKNFFTAALMEQIARRSVDLAVAATEGAVHGKTVTIDVANEILHRAVQAFADNAPGMFRKFSDTIRPKLIARMAESGLVPPEATVSTVPDPQMVIDTKGVTVIDAPHVIGFAAKRAA